MNMVELLEEARDALGRVNTNAFERDLLFQYRGGVLGRELTLIVRDLADGIEGLLDRVETAERRVSRLKNREQKAFEKLRESKAAIARVRELHQVDEYTAGHTIVRCVCEEVWPCSTIKALEGQL